MIPIHYTYAEGDRPADTPAQQSLRAGLVVRLKPVADVSVNELNAAIKLLSERDQGLFASDCAARALRVVEDPDPRSLDFVRVARRFARGAASEDELAAAWDAAWDAWSAAARAAASAAAWDAWTAAARAAAKAAWADSAASAARSTRSTRADRDAELRWQVRRLLLYLEDRPRRDIPLPRAREEVSP